MEAFKDLKTKSLSLPEKEEESAEEVGSGEGEEALVEMAAGVAGTTGMIEATLAAWQQANPQRA